MQHIWDRLIHHFKWKARKEETSDDMSVDVRVILKCTLKKMFGYRLDSSGVG
jgi:hypothetical protein